MTPIWFFTSIEDYEIKNNIIILKENGVIIYEFPIPKDHHIIAIENDNTGYINKFFISKHIPKLPKNIPEGYTNLKLTWDGLYSVTEKKNSIEKKIRLKDYSKYPKQIQELSKIYCQSIPKKELLYMDTSIISDSMFNDACYNRHNIAQNDIPNNFWFNIQYREYVFPLLNCVEWSKLDDISKYIKEFDPNSRLINEYELITINAYNNHGRINPIQYLPINYCQSNKIFIGAGWVNIENWPKIVTDVKHINHYLQVYSEKNMDDFYCSYDCHCYYHNKYSQQPNFLIPVIEEKQLKKVNKHTNKI